ncbi:polyketide synthase 16 [Biomphalaria pfeifferi]|uniref:Polyketide synthase 16 n=1 Tax=Biomphalaria pfeifferi TaxID=112525 RepID=A0AAD8B4J4_BIOPF|nr:polyketide synthase 16 [Biomphalaria pfeifferi]
MNASSSAQFSLNENNVLKVLENFTVINYAVVTSLIAVFGLVANVINLNIFLKHGIRHSYTMNFVMLSASDFCGLSAALLYGLACNPMLPELPFEPIGVAYLMAGALYCRSVVLIVQGSFPRAAEGSRFRLIACFMSTVYPRAFFSKMSCSITVMMTVQRCLCVSAPLKLRNRLTPTRTLTCLMLIAVGMVFVNFIHPFFGSFQLGFDLEPTKNRTTLKMLSRSSYNDIKVVSSLLNSLVFLALFAIELMSTSILIIKLHSYSIWRQLVVFPRTITAKERSHKGKHISRVIVALSVILLISYTPYAVSCLVTMSLDLSGATGQLVNHLTKLMWSVSFVLQNIHSSISIFVYYNMSLIYRKTFQNLIFHRQIKLKDTNKS